MGPITLIKISLKALLRNRMRTFLSVLGIVIGVAAVITMVAMGEGSKKSIKEQMTAMGTNAITIMPNQSRRGGVQMDASSSTETLEEEDVIALRKEATYIDAVSPLISVGGQAIVGNNNSPTSLSGVSADYLKIRNYEIADGVMFDDETDRMAKVCVIGQTVVKNLFADTDPIGKTIRYKNIPLPDSRELHRRRLCREGDRRNHGHPQGTPQLDKAHRPVPHLHARRNDYDGHEHIGLAFAGAHRHRGH